MVQAELAEVFRVEPLKDKPEPKITDWRFLLASLITKEDAVKVARLKLPKESMLTRLAPAPLWKTAMAEV